MLMTDLKKKTTVKIYTHSSSFILHIVLSILAASTQTPSHANPFFFKN